MAKRIVEILGNVPPATKKHLILAGEDTFQTIFFIKRTNGEIRKMNFRLHCKKGINGKGQSYNPENYDLLTVFDLKKDAWRNINLRTVYKLRQKDTEYRFFDNFSEFLSAVM